MHSFFFVRFIVEEQMHSFFFVPSIAKDRILNFFFVRSIVEERIHSIFLFRFIVEERKTFAFLLLFHSLGTNTFVFLCSFHSCETKPLVYFRFDPKKSTDSFNFVFVLFLEICLMHSFHFDLSNFRISRFLSFRYRKGSQDRSFVPTSFRYCCHYYVGYSTKKTVRSCMHQLQNLISQ
jgi:hypothetical protein